MLAEITPDRFRQACGSWATGVAVVTTAGVGREAVGLTMNAVTSLSLEPPLFLICIGNGSETLPAFRQTGVLCINVLCEAQAGVADVFAGKSRDKFSGIPYATGVLGAPRLAGSVMAIECRIIRISSGGDHQIVICEAQDIWINEEARPPLLFYRGRYCGIG